MFTVKVEKVEYYTVSFETGLEFSPKRVRFDLKAHFNNPRKYAQSNSFTIKSYKTLAPAKKMEKRLNDLKQWVLDKWVMDCIRLRCAGKKGLQRYLTEMENLYSASGKVA